MDGLESGPSPPRGLLDSLLDILFPIRCAGCGRRGVNICAECWPAIPWLGDEACPVCASPTRQGRICRVCGEGASGLDGARAACRFEGIARTAIHQLKYQGVRVRAEILGDLLAEAIERRPLAIDVLVPVPLGPGRRRVRGFSQSDLIAWRVGERMSIPVLPSCLERVRETPPQVGLTADQRRENVLGAFRCRDSTPIAGRRVALVDDVFTTGSTIGESARAVRAGGAARVYAVVVARATSLSNGA